MNIRSRIKKLEANKHDLPVFKTCECPDLVVIEPGDEMPKLCADCLKLPVRKIEPIDYEH